MAKGTVDTYANVAGIVCTESAANTLTFKKIETGISMNEKVAWIIQQVEIFYAPSITDYADTGDYLDVGLCVANTVANLANLLDPQILFMDRLMKLEDGTPATSIFQRWPAVRDFTTLAGGGLIVPPNPLYLAAKGSGLASATTTYLRMYYITKELAVDEFWQLVEARRMITA